MSIIKKSKRGSSSKKLEKSRRQGNVTTDKVVYVKGVEDEKTDSSNSGAVMKKREKNSYVPKLSLDKFGSTEQITSSSSSSMITPNTKERIIATNKKNGTADVKDYMKSSPSSSSPSISPNNHRRKENKTNNKEEADNIGSVSTASSSSSTLIPKIPTGGGGGGGSGGNGNDIYEPFSNGLIRLNRKEFDDVKFCFICDTETEKVQPNPCIEKTGLRLNDDGSGSIVYKQIFCCDDCYLKVQAKKEETTYYNVGMSARALTYF